MAEKKKGKGKGEKTQDANGASAGLTLGAVGLVVLGLISMPAMLLFLIGMLPSLAAVITFGGQKGRSAQILSVLFMNFAGCFPFLLEIIGRSYGFDKGIDIIANPLVLITIYAAAGMGYVIDAFFSSYISTFLFSRAKARLSGIEKRQKDIEARWGAEVTGKIPLDEYGFARDNHNAPVAKPPAR